MSLKPAFDLHCHPSFKATLSRLDIDKVPYTPFQPVNVRVLGNIDECEGDPLDSQASGEQLLRGGANLAVCALYGMENAYVWSKVVRNIERFSSDLSTDFMETIRNQRVSYADLISRELAFLDKYKHNVHPGTGYRYKIIDRISDYDPANLNTLHLILAMEGSHCLFTNPTVGEQDFEQVLDKLRFYKTPGNPRLLYLTLVHHAQVSFMNHAFAVPNRWAGVGNGRDGAGGFNPMEAPVSAEGDWLIETALSEADGQRRILIDVKHMSLGARLWFYQRHAERHGAVPIIASHVGMAGVSMNNRTVIAKVAALGNDAYRVWYNRVESFRSGMNAVSFNSWTINLFDEEVAIILRSGGLIGISLDKRILGFNWATFGGDERIGKNDVPPAVARYIRINGVDDDDSPPLPDAVLPSIDDTLFLCSNILHAARIGLSLPDVGERVWDQLCIGSDFDGLISAINVYTAADLPKLRLELVEKLPQAAKKMKIPVPSDIGGLIDRIFHQNAVRFLEEHFV